MFFTWLVGVMGDWTSTVMGTTAPFSAIRGRSILIMFEPSLMGRPPKRRFSVASTFSSGWSDPRFPCPDATPGSPARNGAAAADTPRSPRARSTPLRETLMPSTHSCMMSLLWLACRRPPSDLVIGVTLLAGQEIPCAEMRQQMNEPQLAARPLRLRHRRAHDRVVGDAVHVQPLQPPLGLEQPGPLRARLGEHRVHELGRLRLLVGGQAELGLQLEDVPRPGIAVSIGRERHPEAVPLAHGGFELLGA